MAGAMTLNTVVVGSHLWFCRGGTTIDGAVVEAANPPPSTAPVDNWISLGCVQDVSISRNLERESIYCPSPGQYKKSKNITIQKDMSFNFTIADHSNLFFEMLYSTTGPVADAGASGAFVPNDDEGTVEGWWKIQKYNQDDVIIVSMDIWGEASIDGDQALGRSLNAWNMNLEVLDSPHNTGGLYTFPFTAPAV